MAFFEIAKMAQAYAKIGVLGFAGSGKTYTSCSFAIGLSKMLGNKKPVFFIDTETGADFMIRRFEKEKVKLLVAKRRAFKDLIPMCQEAEKQADILIVDSISAFWKDLMQSYKKKKGRNFISFPDWGILKEEWGRFTDWYINSPLHCIICGRAGWEYNEKEDADGQSKLEKIGTKMKAESEFGYEPSLLIEMERLKIGGEGSKIGERIVHRAHILKDRNDVLDGKGIDNPSFEDFLPTIKLLNLGGKHFALDTETSSEEMFDDNGKTDWRIKENQRQIAMEEFFGFMTANFPSSSGDDKLAKTNLSLYLFNTYSKTELERKSKEEYNEALEKAKRILSVPENLQVLMTKKADLGKLKMPEGKEEQPRPKH